MAAAPTTVVAPTRLQRAVGAAEREEGLVRVFGEVDAGDGDEDLGALTSAALEEVRQLKSPPDVVRRTFEVVHILLHAARYRQGLPAAGVPWESVRRTLASDRLAARLLAFDVGELRKSPALARALREAYFSGAPRGLAGGTAASPPRRQLRRFHTTGEVLSPQRVRCASIAAAAVFAWAARVVTEAASADTPAAAGDAAEDVVLDVVVAEPEDASPDLVAPPGANTAQPAPEADDDIDEVASIGVWATCVGGHGLAAGVVGASACGLCSLVLPRAAAASVIGCRRCGLCVCQDCRRGGWLTAPLLRAPDGHVQRLGRAGFRWLRVGEEPPPPLSRPPAPCSSAVAGEGRADRAADAFADSAGVAATVAGGAADAAPSASIAFGAWWGRDPRRASLGMLDRGVSVEFRTTCVAVADALIVQVSEAEKLRPGLVRRSTVPVLGRVLDLVDKRSLSATVLAIVAVGTRRAVPA